MKSKIGWCDMTWNPVIGCKNNCSYCYAKKINDRFKFIKDWNKPEWREKSFNKKLPKKPQRIFVGSMSEIVHWRKEWIKMVIEKTKEYPQHTFQFLTSSSQVYNDWVFPKNCWLGVTLIRNYKDGEPGRWDFWQFKQDNKNNLKYVSFEPLLMDINLIYYLNLEDIDWIIIGAESGNRKGKVIPKLDWVLEIVRYCEMYKIPIYVKDNLDKYYSEFKDKKEFPKRGKNA